MQELFNLRYKLVEHNAFSTYPQYRENATPIQLCVWEKDAVRTYTVRTNNGKRIVLIYNVGMNVKQRNNSLSKVEQDYRLFIWFLTLVVFIMYVWMLILNPALLQPLSFVLFTSLLVIHVYLHWQIEKIVLNPKLFPVYCLIQGALAFTICWLANMEALTFTLFMALIGESVGMFGLSRRGLLAAGFFLFLNLASLNQISSLVAAGWSLLGVIPILLLTLIYTLLYKRQAEAREKAQELADEIEAVNRQLSEYATQVEDLTISNERQRMARELHDTLSQGLAGIILQLEATEAHLDNQRIEKAQIIISDAKTQARATLADARNAIEDLRQPALDDLDSALRLEISRFINVTGIPVNYRAEQTPPLPDTVKETIIRAVAEALTNVARHAQATQVVVNLSVTEKNLLISVQDDGQGFDADAIPSGHYGLLGIRERIRIADGEFHIQSEIGKGTTLEMKFALPLGEG